MNCVTTTGNVLTTSPPPKTQAAAQPGRDEKFATSTARAGGTIVVRSVIRMRSPSKPALVKSMYPPSTHQVCLLANRCARTVRAVRLGCMDEGDGRIRAARLELAALLKQAYAASTYRSYESVAAAAGMSKASVSNYMRAIRMSADPRMLLHLAQVLGLPSENNLENHIVRLHSAIHPQARPEDVGWQARVDAADCVQWPMSEFSVTDASVHTAIGRRSLVVDADFTPPVYVAREHDLALRRDITAAGQGRLRTLIVLRGTSSTGKTRSLYEAVRELLPSSMVLRPRSREALYRLPRAGVLDRPCVVWLNELQGFLGRRGEGLTIGLLRQLHASASSPLLIVGTLWPAKLRAATESWAEESSDNRELLLDRTPWVTWHDVPGRFTSAERSRAARFAADDPRMQRALADADNIGFTQTLAGAHDLMELYRSPQYSVTRLLLAAAADARRLGFSAPLSTGLLHRLTLSLWREDHGALFLEDSDFRDALEEAKRRIPDVDGIRALYAVDMPGPEVKYQLADYLEQALGSVYATRAVSDETWSSLLGEGIDLEDAVALASSAEIRGRYKVSALFLRRATSLADVSSLSRLASWLNHLPGQSQIADLAYQDAVEAGEPSRIAAWARWMAEGNRHASQVGRAWRAAAATGDTMALVGLATWLAGQDGMTAEAEKTWRSATASGDPAAMAAFARWLSRQPGRTAEAERTLKAAAFKGNALAAREFAYWLSATPGRAAETEEAMRHAAALDPAFTVDLARWLSRQRGREGDAEAAWRNSAASGEESSLIELAWWLSEQPGRETDADRVWSEAASTGNRDARLQVAMRLSRQPGREAIAERAWRMAASSGDTDAIRGYAWWLYGQPDRGADADRAWAALFNDRKKYAGRREATSSKTSIDPAKSLIEEAREIAGKGRPVEAEQAWHRAALSGTPDAVVGWVAWLSSQPDREADAAAAIEQAAENPQALLAVAWWLSDQTGQEAMAEAAFRRAASLGVHGAIGALIGILSNRGRMAEVRQILTNGLESDGATKGSR